MPVLLVEKTLNNYLIHIYWFCTFFPFSSIIIWTNGHKSSFCICKSCISFPVSFFLPVVAANCEIKLQRRYTHFFLSSHMPSIFRNKGTINYKAMKSGLRYILIEEITINTKDSYLANINLKQREMYHTVGQENPGTIKIILSRNYSDTVLLEKWGKLLLK